MHPQIDIHLADVLFNSGWHSASSAQWWFETFDEASTCSRVPPSIDLQDLVNCVRIDVVRTKGLARRF